MKRLLQLQSFIFGSGTIFAYYTVFADFSRFYGFEGTFFKFTGCVVPNPLLTPCFYGAFAFLFGFVWSLFILRGGEAFRTKHQLYLMLLGLAGTIFAWGNTAYGFYKFYVLNNNTGCSGVPTESPFFTPCMVGAIIFAVAFAVTVFARRKTRLTST
ncbi:hypothetical protein KC614_04725 [candidate division WWE3 bacterium]|uniref:Vitamin K epoxide reductase domain-containing protein n=1 Tax=candidate division WWE3 bacterium TaxID=2053526 RepID=A0A955LL31_UNCKA|nr:hypothetical protein [candidate division WWE3 bacterium]